MFLVRRKLDGKFLRNSSRCRPFKRRKGAWQIGIKGISPFESEAEIQFAMYCLCCAPDGPVQSISFKRYNSHTQEETPGIWNYQPTKYSSSKFNENYETVPVEVSISEWSL